jgi:hypothetical protein
MVDVISTVSGGMAIGQNVLRFLNIVRGIREANVIAALFDPDGLRKEGDKRINVILHTEQQEEGTWWYEVEAMDDYSFVRFPVIESGIAEVLGQEVGASNPDARYWRWVGQGLPGRIYGSAGASNARVDFMVVGYRPSALVKHFTKAPK